MELKSIVKIVTILDVILAAILITLYVSLLSEHLQELQLEKRSKRDHVILYIYVCVSVLIQLFFAFRFYQVLSFSNENDDEDLEDNQEDIKEQLRIAKYWTIASYLILLNFIVKTGVYSERCRCVISITLAVYSVSIFFRVCSIYTVREFIIKLEKANEEMKRKERLRTVMVHHYLK